MFNKIIALIDGIKFAISPPSLDIDAMLRDERIILGFTEEEMINMDVDERFRINRMV